MGNTLCASVFFTETRSITPLAAAVSDAGTIRLVRSIKRLSCVKYRTPGFPKGRALWLVFLCGSTAFLFDVDKKKRGGRAAACPCG